MAKNSVDGTKYVLALAEGHLARLEKSLAYFQTCTEIKYTSAYGKCGPMDPRTGKREPQPEFTVVLKASDIRKSSCGEYTYNSTEWTYPDGTKGSKSFSDVRDSEVREVERAIEGVQSDIAFFKTKIAEFKEQ